MKTWRCSMRGVEPQPSVFKPEGCYDFCNPGCRQKGTDESGDDYLPCDAEPVRVIPEAALARKDAALAAADKMLAIFQDIGEALAVPIEWEYEGETIAVATDVAAAREAIAKLNEEAE